MSPRRARTPNQTKPNQTKIRVSRRRLWRGVARGARYNGAFLSRRRRRRVEGRRGGARQTGVAQSQLEGHSDMVYSVSFSPSSAQLVPRPPSPPMRFCRAERTRRRARPAH